MHYLIYYTFIVLSFFFVYLAWDKRFLLSISNVSLFFIYIFVAFPGLHVAERFLLERDDVNSFLLFYFIFVVSFLVPPLAVFLGRGLAHGKKLPKLALCNKSTYRLDVLVCFVVMYSFYYYYYHFNNVPLFAIISQPSLDRAHSAVLRNALTHNLLDFNPNLPFFLRYWRLIMQNIGTTLFLIKYAESIKESLAFPQKSKKSMPLYALFILIFLNLTFTLEKAPVLTFLSQMFAVKLFYTKKFSVLIVFFIVSLPLIMYVFFMGSSFESVFLNLFKRLSSQNVHIVEQYDIYKKMFDEQFLFFRNYRFPIWDFLFAKERVELSSEAYKVVYSTYYLHHDIVGTTGSLTLFHLFTSFGLTCATVLYFLYFIFLGYFSELIIKASIELDKNIYIVIILIELAFFFFPVSTGSLGTLFNSSLFLSPHLLIILFLPVSLGGSLCRTRILH